MKIYDISQEVFSSAVFPGDPAPGADVITRIESGGICNLSSFSMCAHNGTHVDAPFHFFCDGRTIDALPLSHLIGLAFVAEHTGDVTGEDALSILQKAQRGGEGCDKRILIKGDAVITLSAAEVFADAGVYLIGGESQTVGPPDAPAAVHRMLLKKGTVLLEGLRLQAVREGRYLLHAAPLNLGGFDGAPCRATLIDIPFLEEIL